jgi:hypothetical protein
MSDQADALPEYVGLGRILPIEEQAGPIESVGAISRCTVLIPGTAAPLRQSI